MKSKSFQFEVHRTRDRETIKQNRRDANQNNRSDTTETNSLALHKNWQETTVNIKASWITIELPEFSYVLNKYNSTNKSVSMLSVIIKKKC